MSIKSDASRRSANVCHSLQLLMSGIRGYDIGWMLKMPRIRQAKIKLTVNFDRTLSDLKNLTNNFGSIECNAMDSTVERNDEVKSSRMALIRSF